MKRFFVGFVSLITQRAHLDTIFLGSQVVGQVVAPLQLCGILALGLGLDSGFGLGRA